MLPKLRIAASECFAKVYPSNKYIMRFDGCSKGNPGIAGAGAVIYYDKKII